MIPQLDRCGDLVEHIARRGTRGIATALSPRARDIISEMGRVGHDMWAIAGDGWRDADAAAAEVLRTRDRDLDDLHVSLTAEIVGGGLAVPVVMDMTLVGRFYERLGDHAAEVGTRIAYLVNGH